MTNFSLSFCIYIYIYIYIAKSSGAIEYTYCTSEDG